MFQLNQLFILSGLLTTWAVAETVQTLPTSPALLASDWLDQGKAEFNTYDATVHRYGHPRQATITHIWVKEPWNAQRGTKWEGTGRGDFEVIKLNQILSYPTGIYRYEQAWSGFWQRDSARLVKWSFTHHEACGNTFKQAQVAQGQVRYTYFSYFEGEGDGRLQLDLPEGAIFYDELPLQLRLVAANDLPDPVTIPLFPSVIHGKAGPIDTSPATIRLVRSDRREVEFAVQHAGGTDRLVYASDAPHKLLRWEQSDGTTMTLRQSLFTDYWNQNRPGDEKLLVVPAKHDRR